MRAIVVVMKQCVRADRHRARSLSVGFAILVAAVWAPLTSAATHSSMTAAAPSSTSATFYANLTNRQYVNNGGDRARGEGHNPFGNYAGVSLNISVNADELISGPFPGDFAAYQFALFTNRTHKMSVGNAIFFCQYSFAQSSICDVVLDVQGGSIIGKGAMNFDDEQFSLAVTGGTGSFRTVKGTILGTAGGVATQAQPVRRAVPMLQALVLHVTTHPSPLASASGWQRVVITESPDEETFVDNNDDEARGDVNNPWGGFNNGAAKIIDEHVNGPFPGDEAFYSFHVTTQSHGTGLGIFTCQYYFDRNGLCHATFQFGGGTVVAEGAFNFESKTFTLAVTGGYGLYMDEVGQVDAARTSGDAQQLSFELHRT